MPVPSHVLEATVKHYDLFADPERPIQPQVESEVRGVPQRIHPPEAENAPPLDLR